MKLQKKLLIYFLLAGLIPLVLIGVFSMTISRSALEASAFNQLISAREMKSEQIQDYFELLNHQIITFSEDKMVVDSMQEFSATFETFRRENQVDQGDLDTYRTSLEAYYSQAYESEYKSRNDGETSAILATLDQLDDDALALQHHYISGNEQPLGSKHLLNRASDQSTYSALHEEIHPVIASYLDKFGYYDIFLVDLDSGDIVYSVFKELDYGTSLSEGPYANTNFGEAFQRARDAKNKDDVVIVDYAQYLPSYQDPAGFIASPVFDGDKKVGVAIFQFPIDTLNAIMSERAGMGETGEIYLVGKDGLMRSDAFNDPENRNVSTSFKFPHLGSVDTLAVERALKGEKGDGLLTNYLGTEVLSAYKPFEFNGLQWALVAEIESQEAFSSVNSMRNAVIGLLLGMTLIILLTSHRISKSISKPIVSIAAHSRKISELDFTKDVPKELMDYQDEVGDLAKANQFIVDNLKNTVLQIVQSSEQLRVASEEMTQSTEKSARETALINELVTELSQAADRQAKNAHEGFDKTHELSDYLEREREDLGNLTKSYEQVIHLASEGLDIVHRLTQKTSDSAQAIGGVHKKITRTNESSENIAEASKVINAIASKTNLLALNAAIEAARAGESGRGFAVVAEEIRKLAIQSHESLERIDEAVIQLKKDSEESVSTMESVQTIIAEQVSSVSSTKEKYEEIHGAINSSKKALDELVEIENQITLRKEQILQAMNELSQISSQTAEQTSKAKESIHSQKITIDTLATSSEDLSDLARILRELTLQFSV